MKCLSPTNPKTQRLQLNSVLMTSLKKASGKKLNPKSNARSPQSLSNTTRNFWLVSRWMCRFNDSRATYAILIAYDENRVVRDAILVAQGDVMAAILVFQVVPNKSCGCWTLFLCKKFLLFP